MSKKNITVDIVLPVFNEEQVIMENTKILLDFLKHNMKCKYGIIIANSGSKDKTLKKVKKLEKNNKYIKVINLKKRGKGRAIKKAWLKSKADILSFMDIDLSTNLKNFIDLIEHIKKGCDVVIGSRFLSQSVTKRSIKRELISKSYNTIVRLFFNTKIKDLQCGFKAINKKIKKKILPKIKNDKWFFDTELLITCERKGYKIKEIPVNWIEDKKSKLKLKNIFQDFLWPLIKLKIELTKK